MTTPQQRVRRGPKSSLGWLEHFRANEEPEVLTREGPRLSEAEKAAVVASVQEFQLGESSEGRHLHRLAAEHARRTDDEDYLRAIEYFIREEQRHARYLRDFLALEGFGTIKHRWTDTVFRRLRNLAGLEVSIGVLLTAEVIAKVYYEGLKGATRSLVLRRICERILRDEEAHVRFQSERLAVLRRGRPEPGRKLTGLPHRTLFFGACLVVWKNHGEAMRRGGMDFRGYWLRCWEEFGTAAGMMAPESYTFPAHGKEGLSPRRMTDDGPYL
ncbi:MAG TPA: ferritin-like domain-containing protein [Rubrobacteraceae bacterium]|nr:ferritin-like domain-containing protein [Rubrobacteraceae bacterium]